MSVVEEISSTDRIDSLDEGAETFGIAKSGLRACTRHCPNENLGRHPQDSSCLGWIPLDQNQIRILIPSQIHQNTWRQYNSKWFRVDFALM